ncbi:MAG: MBL fold metallo-hydrolase [Candidatus Aminicenantes bacterium]|nr:MBL fold metallo-hydrolase [Candidatus Aminicenantes bacterium]MDH5706137.1 MBL fold metallo-hydrolase [Candidatus Aminicenantes bacterium]
MIRRIGRILIALSISFTGLSIGARSQVLNYLTKQKQPPLKIVKVANGIYMAKGEWGSNVGFCTWNNEVLVIDSKATKDATEKVIKEIGKITKNPITRVVFTHSDPDSFNGRDAYPDTAEIICSLRVLDDYKKNPTVYLEMNAPAAIYAAWPRSDFIPAMTFEGQLNIRLGHDEVTLLHYGPAHTSGDTIVWFPSDRVAFIGDLVFDGHEPLIQDQKGGNSLGLVRVLSILFGLKPEVRTFIPSHGDPVGRDIVQQNLGTIEEVRSKVTAMFDAGKSLEDVKKAFGVREPPQEAGAWIWPSLAVTVYRELSRKKF